MAEFSEALQIRPGITAIIGGGGKTSLLYRLAEELSDRGRVIVTTTTHIWKPEHLPFALRSAGERLLCVGTPNADGKLTAPEQSMAELERLADYVLVEADGSAGRPLKAHAPHEPAIPPEAENIICVVGASGLNRPVFQAAHRPEIFSRLCGGEIATAEAVALVLEREHFHTRVLINQTDTQEEAAKTLAALLTAPVALSCLKKGEIQCW